MFRAVKVTRDGRRQIFAFYMPGDMCGLEPDDTHGLTIEAVNAGTIATLSRQVCRARMNRDPQFNAAVFDNVTRALDPRRRPYDDGRAQFGRGAPRLVPVDAERAARADGAPLRSSSPCSVRTSPTISA